VVRLAAKMLGACVLEPVAVQANLARLAVMRDVTKGWPKKFYYWFGIQQCVQSVYRV
jgi:hypothetical protein